MYRIIFTSFFSLLSGYVLAQINSDSILIDNHYRSFHFIKSSKIRQGVSLVFILHGSGGNGMGMINRTTKLAQIARSEKVILVYPDGYKNYWNECRKEASSLANKENIDENTFFSKMIDYFKTTHQINDQRVFAVGTSGGGHMCYKLALTMPHKFRAITAIIASLPDTSNMDCTEARLALPVMIINGTADPLNRYEGGMMESGNFKMGRVRSTDNSFHYWADLAGYRRKPVKSLLPDTDPNDGKTIERYTFQSSGKPEIVLLKVVGGKHEYPNDIDVHVEAWEFFKRQLK